MKPQSATTRQIAAVLVAVVAGVWYAHFLPWTAWRIAGAILAAPALAVWILARLQLGRSFAVKAKATELVTHGLYSKIRNPVYLFGALFIAGFVLMIAQPIWLLVLVVIVPLQIFRARKEAKVLEDKFGDVYREYRARTWF